MFGKTIVVNKAIVKPEIGKRAVLEITETSPYTGRKLKREIETGIINFLIEDCPQDNTIRGFVCEDEFETYTLYSRWIPGKTFATH